MKSAQIPENETERLQALHRYLILDTPPAPVFDELTKIAAIVCKAPVATITFIDKDREWYKSKIGITDEQASRDISLCAHTILGKELLIVPDTLKDDRFFDNPFVLDKPPLRFYAAVPLITPDGYALGTLCVIDHIPRKLTVNQINVLKILAHQVMLQLEYHSSILKYTVSKLHLYDHIVSGTTDFISFIDRNYTYQIINDSYLRVFNKRRDEIVGHTLADLFGEDFFLAYQKQRFDQALAGQKSGYETWFDLPLLGRRYLIVDYTPFYESNGSISGVIVSTHDITERKQSEEDILQSRERLRNLAARLHAIREEERTRISREIHDELGQTLTGLRIDMAWILKMLSPGQHTIEERVRHSLLVVDESLDVVRRISYDLRPAILDDLGLTAAIDLLLKEFHKNFQIQPFQEVLQKSPARTPDHF